MATIEEQILAIEKEIRETPYHKGTEHHIGKLRARVARLGDRMVESSQRGGGGGGSPPAGGFAIKKHGDATVVLVGFPSVGKSTLLNALTNAKSPTADYAFTTVTVIPGMMKYKGAQLQILDVPGLVEKASSGRGRGREVLSVVRSADLLLMIAKKGNQDEFNRMNKELYLNGVRVNRHLPNVLVKKSLRGGVKVNLGPCRLSRGTVESVAFEFGFINGEIFIREDLNIEDLIDVFAKNRVYVKALYVASMVDKISNIKSQVSNGVIPISARTGEGLNSLRGAIWNALELVRIYLKRPDGGVDREKPMILREGQTLSEVAQKVGTDFAESKKLAKIWGHGARFPGQEVSLSTKVSDEIEVMFG